MNEDATSDNTRNPYHALMVARPDLFVNPSPDGILILLDSPSIAAAEKAVLPRVQKRGYGAEAARVGVVYADPYLTILRDAVRFPDGALGTYIRLIREPGGVQSVAMLPVWNDKILLLRHFRHASRDWRLEIPRGFGEDGQSSEENARRELMEEINATPRELIALGSLEADSGLSGDVTDLFLAFLDGYGAGEAAEAISDVLPVSIEELERLIADGRIIDGYTIAAFARARLRGLV